MGTALQRNRLIAFVAACALIVCVGVYAAHGLTDRAHEHSHCDLCLHFSGSAGSPAQAKALTKPVLVVRVAVVRAPTVLPTRSPLGHHLPRGPPSSLTVI